MLVLALVLTLIVSSSGRDICAKFGLKSFNKNEKNVVCYNSTSRTVHSVSSLNNHHVSGEGGRYILTKIYFSFFSTRHQSVTALIRPNSARIQEKNPGLVNLSPSLQTMKRSEFSPRLCSKTESEGRPTTWSCWNANSPRRR